jgi:hypothetical protein
MFCTQHLARRSQHDLHHTHKRRNYTGALTGRGVTRAQLEQVRETGMSLKKAGLRRCFVSYTTTKRPRFTLLPPLYINNKAPRSRPPPHIPLDKNNKNR